MAAGVVMCWRQLANESVLHQLGYEVCCSGLSWCSRYTLTKVEEGEPSGVRPAQVRAADLVSTPACASTLSVGLTA